LRPGITIQHARELVRDTGLVRSDVTAFIGIIPRLRWPRGAQSGDFVELPLTSHADLLSNPGRAIFDPVTRRAVKSFFENGGLSCRVIGLCVASQKDLLVDDPFSVLFQPLLERLRGDEDIGILTMPVLAYAPVEFEGMDAKVLAQPVMELFLTHCREMNNRFVIFDTPRDLHELPLRRWVRRFRKKNETVASYGAIYYPWLMAGDEMFPPSGAMAGIFARVEKAHDPFGVHWPPANELVQGVTHPAVPILWKESGTLADANINPILNQPGSGVVVWGARTLSEDPRWIHINSRRIVSFICEQLRRDSEWAVFENQRPELWKILERIVRNRLDMLWEAGLLAGDQPGLEYLVKCDAELNPPEVRDAGQVHVNVVLRPIATAESIVVELRLAQEGSTIGSI